MKLTSSSNKTPPLRTTSVTGPSIHANEPLPSDTYLPVIWLGSIEALPDTVAMRRPRSAAHASTDVVLPGPVGP